MAAFEDQLLASVAEQVQAFRRRQSGGLAEDAATLRDDLLSDHGHREAVATRRRLEDGGTLDSLRVVIEDLVVTDDQVKRSADSVLSVRVSICVGDYV